jgi:rRNA maturation protein Nop10
MIVPSGDQRENDLNFDGKHRQRLYMLHCIYFAMQENCTMRGGDLGSIRPVKQMDVRACPQSGDATVVPIPGHLMRNPSPTNSRIDLLLNRRPIELWLRTLQAK